MRQTGKAAPFDATMLWRSLARVAGPLAALAVSAWAGGGTLGFHFEQRTRVETRTGVAFGRDPDIHTALLRTRLGISFAPAGWLRLSATAQDARAPWHRPGAPAAPRDPVDLYEAYLELFPERDAGFGVTAGRRNLSLGESRLVGTPQWANCPRPFDQARLYYRWAGARLDLFFASPVRMRPGEFNRPVLGERLWGIYGSFSGGARQRLLDLYLLRRDTADRRVNTAGFRAAGPATRGTEYGIEAAAQTGNATGERRRAGAWVGCLRRQFTLGETPVTVSGEYKFASSAFDQLYASNHDRFGHQDLFGWRNIHNTVSSGAFAVKIGRASCRERV